MGWGLIRPLPGPLPRLHNDPLWAAGPSGEAGVRKPEREAIRGGADEVSGVRDGCELNQERPTWTFKPQKVGKQDCVLLLSTISLGEKAKEEVNVVEIVPSASQDDKKRKPLTLASLRASVLPMVVLGLEFSPPVTFQLRAGSGPVFLCGQEHYNRSWEEVEEEEEDLEEEEDDDDDDEDIDMFLEETPVKQVKRLVPQKQTGAAKTPP
ncbi:nucleoplasmin-2 isoform X2 [Cervus elaphus]|uniref:nucleoplasmin-2 isoform X2 n=1 Tax=Cervus canadensis TaxID=1574408 RepID=UPI001CA3599D|nr:nucleoplasmin-2 isoform X2 [Cervus canadensis]XP_043783143.1 nucleoplasmin-2 isoform X2 [Cervus elaphus]